MGWNILLVNTKTFIILIILSLFLLLAFLFLLLEIKIKKTKKVKFTQDVESSRIAHIKKSLERAKTKSEKLDAINLQAKSLFREHFHLGPHKSYSELVEIFNEKKLYKHSLFCQKMFEVYYSEEGLNELKLKELVTLLIKLIREKRTYLDPEKYKLENIYKDKKSSKEHNDPEHKNTVNEGEQNHTEHKSLLEKKQKSLKEKQELLLERQKMINQRERELSKKEKQNKKLLEQIEDRIRDQEKRIKDQEEIQKKIREQLKFEEKRKQMFLDYQKKKHLLDREHEEKEQQKEIKKYWRERIDTDTIIGKDWLKQHKKKRHKRR